MVKCQLFSVDVSPYRNEYSSVFGVIAEYLEVTDSFGTDFVSHVSLRHKMSYFWDKIAFARLKRLCRSRMLCTLKVSRVICSVLFWLVFSQHPVSRAASPRCCFDHRSGVVSGFGPSPCFLVFPIRCILVFFK